MSDRITRDVGWVADRWLRELRASRSFALGTSLQAGAGNFTEIQLLNPAGSTVTAILHTVSLISDTTDIIDIRRFDTALATLIGSGVNLNLGAAAGSAVLRTATPAAVDGTLMMRLTVTANQPLLLRLPWLFEMAAGRGVLVAQNTAATTLRITYWWIEV